jgi:hypothetical protein
MLGRLSTWTTRLHATATAHLVTHLPGRANRGHTDLEHGDGGYSAEAVVVTALLVACAILVVGIIVAKVTNLANSIQM